MNAGAIILAGGKSSRMGTNKALLDFAGKKNIERISDSLQEVFTDITIVTNDLDTFRFLNLPMVSDKYLDKGPLAGIQAGLNASPQDINFVVACDMPFVSSALAQYLIEQLRDNDIVVPSIAGKLHPLFSVFNKSALSVIDNNLAVNKLRIIDLFAQLKVLIIQEDKLRQITDNLEHAFYNMNNQLDYENAKKKVTN